MATPPQLPAAKPTKLDWGAFAATGISLFLHGGFLLDTLGITPSGDGYKMMVAFFYGCPAALTGLGLSFLSVRRDKSKYGRIPLIICLLILIAWVSTLVIELVVD
ncbi:MAG: hypothetical protein K0Q55_4067 [Verrucomicrobia bacterium]|jgi:hypothetical protein|nr:hypothetical protein [Verrucomicrobiota bacterium]